MLCTPLLCGSERGVTLACAGSVPSISGSNAYVSRRARTTGFAGGRDRRRRSGGFARVALGGAGLAGVAPPFDDQFVLGAETDQMAAHHVLEPGEELGLPLHR